MTQTIYIASYNVTTIPIIDVELNHAYLFYDPNTDLDDNPETGTGMRILRGDNGISYAFDGISLSNYSNLVVEVRSNIADSEDWFNNRNSTATLDNFTPLLIGGDLSSDWSTMSSNAENLGDLTTANEVYSMGIGARASLSLL